MKLIFIRGNSFSGKSRLADKLGEKLGADVLHIDHLKTSARMGNPHSNIVGMCSRAYDAAIKWLEKELARQSKIVIVEELGKDQELIDKLRSFIARYNIKTSWVRVLVSLDELNKRRENKIREYESTGRVLKITEEDLVQWEAEIEKREIAGEILVCNNNSEESGLANLLTKLPK